MSSCRQKGARGGWKGPCQAKIKRKRSQAGQQDSLLWVCPAALESPKSHMVGPVRRSWHSRWWLQEGGCVQVQLVPGTVARSNSKARCEQLAPAPWVHQMQGRKITGIKFPFWSQSHSSSLALPYSSPDHARVHVIRVMVQRVISWQRDEPG